MTRADGLRRNGESFPKDKQPAILFMQQNGEPITVNVQEDVENWS